jgi:hypothetical protein
LEEIDAAFFGAPGKPAEALQAARAQFVERLYGMDPAAFREMVEQGQRILQSGVGRSGATDAGQSHASVQTGTRGAQTMAAAGHAALPQELVGQFRVFEREANAELERSVGGVIERAMEAALPNLRSARGGSGARDAQGTPLRERLSAAVREEVVAGMKSDAALGEQVARILSGRRFDPSVRAQVVRLIDSRAQQLVPGAVRRVVSEWTRATLGENKGSGREVAERGSVAATGNSAGKKETARPRTAPTERVERRGRVDYRKLSDEQILEL